MKRRIGAQGRGQRGQILGLLSVGVALLPAAAQAQIDRTRAPQPVPTPTPPAPIVRPALPSPSPLLNQNRGLSPFVGQTTRPGLPNMPGAGINYNSLFQRNALPNGNYLYGPILNGGVINNGSGFYGGVPTPSYRPQGQYPQYNYYDVTRDFTLLNDPTRVNKRIDRPGDVLNGGTMPGSLPAARDIHGNYIGPGSPDALSRYSHSAENARFHNRFYQYGNWGSYYFPSGSAYYPYYASSFDYGLTVVSPYGYYYGALPAYIGANYVYQAPPQYVYVPYPVYQDGSMRGYRSDDVDDYYLNRPNTQNNQDRGDSYRVGEEGTKAVKPTLEAALTDALNDITSAWRNNDVEKVAKHIRKDARVAVYLRGKYQYSLDSADYLDLTRDALRATKTSRFTLDEPQRKENGVYTVTGRHTYVDKQGQERTVFISYVLEKSDGAYYVTQIGSAPQQLNNDQQ